MSLFDTLKNAIFRQADAAGASTGPAGATDPAGATGPAGAATTLASVNSPDRAAGSQPVTPNEAPAQPQTSSSNPSSSATAAPANASVDIEAVLNQLTAKSQQKLNWRTSIVDLMQLLGLDSSVQRRKELAAELGYKGDTNDLATMNIWLHKEVMTKLAVSGGKVPVDLQR